MDWLGYTLLLVQLYLLTNDTGKLRQYIKVKEVGCMIGLVGSICIVIYGFYVKSIPTIGMNLIASLINLKGIKS